MTFKDWRKTKPHWLKGGIIGIIFGIILVAYNLFSFSIIDSCQYEKICHPALESIFKYGLFLEAPAILTGALVSVIFQVDFIHHFREIVLFGTMIFFPSAGLIIGWIIGKIKSK